MTTAAPVFTGEALPAVLVAAWQDAPYAVAFVDTELCARWVNPAFTALTGRPYADHLGRTLAALLPTSHPSLEDRARESLQRGVAVSGVRVEAVSGDALTHRLRATIHPVYDSDRTRVGACVMCTDISDETRLIEELWHAQKQAAASQLANVFAHDFNNLLVVIQGYCELLAMKASDETLKDRLGRIHSAAEAAAGLSRQLLALSRRSAGAISAIDLNLLLRTLRAAVERALPPNIKKSFVLDESLGLVLADAGQIEQVVMTLVLQAIGAMPTGGTLKVETANTTVSDSNVMAGVLVAGEYVRLSVSNSGAAMSATELATLFEPEVPPASPDVWTGIGLLAVRSLVRALHGELQVESVPEHGTRYTVWLPRQIAATVAAMPAIPPTPGARAISVLFVEPDALVRDAISAGLAEHGFEVAVASTVNEALRIAASPTTTVDVLVTSDVFADGDGRMLAVECKRMLPGVRMLVVTSGTTRTQQGAGSDSVAWPLLAKPYTLQDVVRTIYATLYPASAGTIE